MPVDSQYYQAEQARQGADAQPEHSEPENDTDRVWRVVSAMRNEQGQWQKGVSGNPAGRPLGSRNRATLMAQALLDASAAIMVSKTIEKAVAGDGINQRFCLARVIPPRRSAPVELDLPPLDTQKDIALAIAAVGKAVATGEVTPAEAVELAKMFETAMRAIEARETEFATDHFWGRKRPPAAPPLPTMNEAPAQPDEAAIDRSPELRFDCIQENARFARGLDVRSAADKPRLDPARRAPRRARRLRNKMQFYPRGKGVLPRR